MTTPLISDIDQLISLTKIPVPGEDIHNILQTNKFSQITTVYLKPEKNIGFERHVNPASDQIIFVLEGMGMAMLGKDELDVKLQYYEIATGSFITIPAGIRHDIYNTSENDSMKLLIIYTPPIH